jgi:hypothetical protein
MVTLLSNIGRNDSAIHLAKGLQLFYNANNSEWTSYVVDVNDSVLKWSRRICDQ